MNRITAGIVFILGLAASSAATASGAFVGRIGATAGTYEFNSTFTDMGCCGEPVGTQDTGEDNTGQYGGLGGIGLTLGRFFVDGGVEVVQYSSKYDSDGDGSEDASAYRSDGLFTLGVFIGDRWTLFGGYRAATFGDGVFSETDGFTEDGPFLGGGVSFRAGSAIAIGMSAAYNILTLAQEGDVIDEVDLNGFSAKTQVGFVGTPHAIFLRWQRFSGSEGQTGSYEYEYTEDYVNLGYQATFDFASW